MELFFQTSINNNIMYYEQDCRSLVKLLTPIKGYDVK